MCTEEAAQKPLPGCQPGRSQWPVVGRRSLSANLLREDGAQHSDCPVVLPEGLQGMAGDCSMEEGILGALRCSRRWGALGDPKG